jgi:iron complex outermembrane receptor protein
MTSDETSGSGVDLFTPRGRTQQTPSAFLQDTIGLIPDRLSFIAGSKVENTFYSGWEVEPSARLQATLTDHQATWASVSRAVRTPSRLERDLTFGGLINGAGFDSEKLMAYELGYRVEPLTWLSIDVAGFYNDYSDLLSVEPSTGTFVLGNGLKGYTQGFELSSHVQALSWWRLSGSYSFLDMNLRTKAGSLDTTTVASTDASSPRHQVSLHSLMNLPHQTELDPVLRYASALPAQNTPQYMELDIRVAWRPIHNLELSLVGQNLLHDHHPEFSQVSELERGVYGKVTWTW